MQTTVGRIRIGKYVFTSWKSISITNDNDQLLSTCEIKLPNLFAFTERPVMDMQVKTPIGKVNSLIQTNDLIEIWLGTKLENMTLRFLGYVTRYYTHDFVIVTGEDAMYLVKNNNVPTKYFEKATLKNLVDFALTGIKLDVKYEPAEIFSTNMGEWAIKNENLINGVQILNEITPKFGITFKVINEYIDKKNPSKGYQPYLYAIAPARTVNPNKKVPLFIFEHNIKPNNNLQFNKDDSKKFVLKCIANNEIKDLKGKLKNQKIVVYICKKYIVQNSNLKNGKIDGEFFISDIKMDGEQRCLNVSSMTRAELIKAGKDNFDRIVYTGLVGSIDCFIDPPVVPNERIRLHSVKYPEKNGYYKVKAVITTVDEDKAGNQQVTLNYKFNDDGTNNS